MKTVTFKFYGSRVYAPKSNVLMMNWQRNIKLARQFDNDDDIKAFIDKLNYLASKYSSITDIKVIEL